MKLTIEPLHLLSLVIGMTAVILLVIPITDIDSYWHVVIGSQILSGTPLHDVGRTWLAEPGSARNWLTSQWLSEVAMAWTVHTWGWGGLVAGKLLLYVAALVACAVAVMPQRRAAISLPVFAACVVAVGSVTQERPQGASLIFLPLVALACQRIWSSARRPPVLVVASLTCLWANLHGLWLIAPGAFGLVFLVTAITSKSITVPMPLAALTTAITSLAGGLLNPLGLSSLLLPMRFRSASARLIEWQPTDLWSVGSAGFLALVLMTTLAWAAPGRYRKSVKPIEWIWVAFWLVFALPAQRNVVVSALMLAPITATALSRSFPSPPARSNRREQGLLLMAGLAVILISGVIVANSLFRLNPLALTFPISIARQLAQSPLPLRVLNTYNASGPLIAFSDGKAKLAIDGRADLWQGRNIGDSQDLTRLGPHWRRTILAFDPDAIVTGKGNALDQMLEATSTAWRRSIVDGPYILWLRDHESKLPLVPARH